MYGIQIHDIDDFRRKSTPDCLDVEETVVEMDVEWGGVNIERLPLPRQDSEHCAHHQQGVPATTHRIILKNSSRERWKQWKNVMRQNVLQQHAASWMKSYKLVGISI